MCIVVTVSLYPRRSHHMPLMRRTALAIAILTSFVCATSLSAQTLTWTGATSGSQNVGSNPTVPFRTPGTYTVTVSAPMTITFKGVAGGGGGGGGSSQSFSAAGGGGGGATT